MQLSEDHGSCFPRRARLLAVWLTAICLSCATGCDRHPQPRDGEARWLAIETGGGPPARHDASLAAAAGAGRVYLFGGRDLDGCLGDLWSFDPKRDAWEQIETESGPEPRSGAGLAWDPEGGRLVLYGGYCHDELGRRHFMRDLWWFTPGEGWSREFLAGGPGPRAWHAMTVSGRRAVVFGGSGPAPRSHLQEIWALDLQTPRWVRLAADGGPRMAGRPVVTPAPDEPDRLHVLGRDGIPTPRQAGVWTLSLPGDGWSGPGGAQARPPVDFHTAAAGAGGWMVLLAGPSPTRTGWSAWWRHAGRKEWHRARVAGGPACPTGMACAPEPGAQGGFICFGGARREEICATTWRLRVGGEAAKTGERR